MMLRALALSGTLAVAVSMPWLSGAQEYEAEIMGGPATAGYNQLARDIADMAARCGVSLDVAESQGGLDNFLAVRQRPYTPLGLSRSDVLEYMETYAADDPAVAEALEGVRVVMPLHDEEVHVLARRDIGSLRDLEGKRVGIGPPGSGTFITASLLLDLAGIRTAERVAMGFNEMIPALFADQLDAAFGVFAAPVDLPGASQLDPSVWHFVPVEDPTIEAVYEPVTIPANTYPFQPEPVETVAAQAVLLTYEFDPDGSSYQRQSCRAVSDVSHLVTTRLDELRELGHPSWRTVELGAEQPGWQVSTCAARGMSPTYELDCEAGPEGPVDDADAAYRSRICQSLGIEC